MRDLKLGLQLGYWGANPPPDLVGIAQEAERLGYDSVWTAEAWGSDAFTPLAWIGAHTSRIRLGTSVVQLSARTPTCPRAASLWASASPDPRSSRAGTASPSASPWPGHASTSTSSVRCCAARLR
jgi:hypothetical protein